MSSAMGRLETTCCIAGGGPAGMMLGYLLARAGIDVVVLEKHQDFLRDFRGDTIHPSTLQVMHELGLLDDLLKIPHQEMPVLRGRIGGEIVKMVDFSYLPTRCKFIALMPQWDFLDFLAERGKSFPNFHLHMDCEVTELIEADGKVIGVRTGGRGGTLEISAHLVIGADGRRSAVRQLAGLEVIHRGAPIDVLWMRISRQESDPETPLGNIDAGRVVVLINRGEYWQCAWVLAKGELPTLQTQGMESFRQQLGEVAPFLGERTRELESWDDIKLLSVQINRLRRWCRPGLLCIGDAAHAMSPIGGVGINLAIQDAVAAGNLLAASLRAERCNLEFLDRVQRRRELATFLTQELQVQLQKRVVAPALASGATSAPLELPPAVRLIQRYPVLAAIPAFVVGLGFRPEHVSNELFNGA